MLPQLEQRSSLPRSRCKSVAFALHQKWGAEVEGTQLKVLPRSQENWHIVLKCRNILLSNMKIFFFWQVQNVLALKTSSCLTLTSRTDCPLGKLIENNREYLHLGRPSYCPAHISHSAMRIHQWRLPFPTRAIWTLSNLWDLCSQRPSSGYGVGRFLRGSHGIHIKALLLLGLSRQLRNKDSPIVVTQTQRAVNKNMSCFSSIGIGIGMSMTAINKNCPWERTEKAIEPLLSYGCILLGTIPKHFLPVIKAISLRQEVSGSLTTVLTECQDQHGNGYLWSSPLGKL